MTEDPIITVKDVQAVGFCVRGLRRWLEGHDIEPRRFFDGEVHASEILATGDALGQRVVDYKASKG